MKIKNITEEVESAKKAVIDSGNTLGDSWQDHIDWKDIKYDEGFTHVQIEDKIFEFDKWGTTHQLEDK